MEKIIDGVNVAECEFINACNKKWKCVILQDDVCETNPYCEGYDCYFKQLKRLEKENEELKQKLEKIKEIVELQLRNCSCNLTDYKSGCKSCESKYAREISLEINKIIEEQ